MKPFQIGVLAAFAALAVFAVLIFATFSGRSAEDVGSVTIWGTISKEVMSEALDVGNTVHSHFDNVKYQQVEASSFMTVLVEAIAAGRGPDLVLLPAASIVNEQDKITPISYTAVSRRNFQDAFVEAGEVFLADSGVLGLPFYIDPFVSYWNRTLFSNAGIPRALKYWDEFVDVAPLLSESSEGGTLTRSAVALGEWDNVNHAKDIFVSLVVGLGNPVITRNQVGEYIVTLADKQGTATSPAESALRFYTEFSDPVQQIYSWNRSQPNSHDAFAGGTLAVYLGKASETFTIRGANPNLNFDVASYPEARGGVAVVPAEVHALAIPRGSRNTAGALQAARVLSGVDVQRALVDVTGLPSVRRDVLSVSPENPYESIFRDAALNAYAFLDPNTRASEKIFKDMVEGVSSGRFRISEAVRSAQAELEALLK